LTWKRSPLARVGERSGAFEAKNKFGQLLDWSASGEEVTITRHGKEVARLVPAKPGFNREEARAAYGESGSAPNS
jgi:prevent-host-death family protein